MSVEISKMCCNKCIKHQVWKKRKSSNNLWCFQKSDQVGAKWHSDCLADTLYCVADSKLSSYFSSVSTEIPSPWRRVYSLNTALQLHVLELGVQVNALSCFCPTFRCFDSAVTDYSDSSGSAAACHWYRKKSEKYASTGLEVTLCCFTGDTKNFCSEFAGQCDVSFTRVAAMQPLMWECG